MSVFSLHIFNAQGKSGKNGLILYHDCAILNSGLLQGKIILLPKWRQKKKPEKQKIGECVV